MKMLGTVMIADRLLQENAQAALVALGVDESKSAEMLELAVKTGFAAWFIWIVIYKDGLFDIKKITIDFDGSDEQYAAALERGSKNDD